MMKMLRLVSLVALVAIAWEDSQAAVMVRKAAWQTPGRVFAHIQDALNAAAPGEEVYVDGMDACEPVHLVKPVILIGTGDIQQSEWTPTKSCITTLTFDKNSPGSFVHGFVVGSVVGDSNIDINIANCHITGNVDINADAGYGNGYYKVDIEHNVLDGNITFPGHLVPLIGVGKDTTWVQQPGVYSYVHNNVSHGHIFAYQNECNGGAEIIGGCLAPWHLWGPDSLLYSAKASRVYYRRADLDRSVVTQGEQIHVRFKGVMAPP